MPRDLPCADCGELMYRVKRSLPQGQARCHPCRRRAHGRDVAVPKPAPAAARPIRCANQSCGLMIQKPRARQVYCSTTCRPPREGHGHGEPRPCEVCAAVYRPSYTKQRACGRICGAAIQGRVRQQWPKSPVYVEPCAVCEKLTVYRRKREIWTCSARCSEQRLNPKVEPRCGCGAVLDSRLRRSCDQCLLVARQERRQRERRRRRALKRGALTEHYTMATIAARDHNRCGLCGKRVAMTKVAPHDRAPTIDHVLPLVCDGDNVRANVQLAHFICNSRKSAGGTQQLALIG